MTLLKDASDKEIEAELRRRVQEKEALRNTRMSENAIRIEKFLTPEFVDNVVPKHDRTSCSDTNRINGVRVSYHNPRCRRCSLLDIIGDGVWPKSLNLTVRIENYDE